MFNITLWANSLIERHPQSKKNSLEWVWGAILLTNRLFSQEVILHVFTVSVLLRRWCWLLLKLACVSQDHICYAEFFLNVQITKFLSQNDIVLATSFSTICSCLDTICSVPEQLLLLMRFREEICSIQKTAIKVKKNNNYVINNFRMKTILMNLDDENNISNNIAMIIIANKIIIIILKSFK